MPAQVKVATEFGVIIISGMGKFIPKEWFIKLKKAGWVWHQVPRQFTKKYLSAGSLVVEREAQSLVDQYNNRFSQAA